MIVLVISLAGCGGPTRLVANWAYFRPVECVIPAYVPSNNRSQSSTVPSPTAPGYAECATQDTKSLSSTPPGEDLVGQTVVLQYFYGPQRYVLGPADLTSSSVTRASVIASKLSGYEVQIDLTPAGASAFNRTHHEALDVNGVTVWTSSSPAYNGIVVVVGPATAPLSKNQADALAGRIKEMATSK